MNYNNPNSNPNMGMNYNPNMRSTMMMGSGGGGAGVSNPYNPNLNPHAHPQGNRGGGVNGDLVLKASCEVCGNSSELYGSPCKHMTLCLSCGKRMAAERQRCHLCATPITKLIREYNVRAANACTDKTFSIGRFVSGIPPFSRKRSAEIKWSLHKDGLQGRQLTDAQKEKMKNKPWILEDETGQHQFQGQLEGSNSRTATYYLLMLQGREFQAIPAGSWYNFTKIAQYKQLTLEEAEEKMNKRRSNATGYERWMMKAATNGAAAFGVPLTEPTKKPGEGAAGTKDPADAGARGKKGKKGDGLDDEEEKGEEDENEEAARRDRLGLTKKGGGGDDDEDGGKGDIDLDDDDIEKGDDWEHEEIFTDDDEAVGNDPLEREDLAPEIPAPPEIKQDEEEEEGEENGGLSNSGKELKKLLGKAAGLESDAEDDDDDDEQEDEASPVLAPNKKEAMKDEPDVDKSPSKPEDTKPGKGGKGTPASSKSNKGKRKATNEESKLGSSAPSKKPKAEPEEIPTPVKSGAAQKGSSVVAKGGPSSAASTSPVTEDEIRKVLLSSANITTQELVGQFRSRLRNADDKKAFTEILRRISKIQKNPSGIAYVVLK
ncbi:transcription initiation factor IIF subunit alpha [Carex littledalei]|uniref:Transcription initiation factor IIF subunit alpha n=1 Tax=Carex littledalei TaxID=544730 RepID=A0A833RII5_9POAL|nr:transcription initiation factor IIF subunit alpha [Carex littledalei]